MKLTIWWRHFLQTDTIRSSMYIEGHPHSQQSTVKNSVDLGQVVRSCLASGWHSTKKPTLYLDRALTQKPCGPDGGKKQHQAEVLGHCANPFRARGTPQTATGSYKGMQSPVWMETSGNMLWCPLLHFIIETSGFPCFQASDLSRSLREVSDARWMLRLYFVDSFLENLANADSESTEMRKADSTMWTADGFPIPIFPATAHHPHQVSSHTYIAIVCGAHSFTPRIVSVCKEDWEWVVLSSHNQWGFSQLHILLIYKGMVLTGSWKQMPI